MGAPCTLNPSRIPRNTFTIANFRLTCKKPKTSPAPAMRRCAEKSQRRGNANRGEKVSRAYLEAQVMESTIADIRKLSCYPRIRGEFTNQYGAGTFILETQTVKDPIRYVKRARNELENEGYEVRSISDLGNAAYAFAFRRKD